MTVIQGNPLFGMDTGRLGSTIFHRLLCSYHEVAWLNRIPALDPSRLAWHRAYMRTLDAPGVGRWITKRVYAGRSVHLSEAGLSWIGAPDT